MTLLSLSSPSYRPIWSLASVLTLTAARSELLGPPYYRNFVLERLTFGIAKIQSQFKATAEVATVSLAYPLRRFFSSTIARASAPLNLIFPVYCTIHHAWIPSTDTCPITRPTTVFTVLIVSDNPPYGESGASGSFKPKASSHTEHSLAGYLDFLSVASDIRIAPGIILEPLTSLDDAGNIPPD